MSVTKTLSALFPGFFLITTPTPFTGFTEAIPDIRAIFKFKPILPTILFAPLGAGEYCKCILCPGDVVVVVIMDVASIQLVVSPKYVIFEFG